MQTVQAEIERDNSFQRVIGSIWRRTRCARLLLCLVLAGVLAFGPSISGGRQSESRHDAVKRATTKINSKPISDIRVGERVWTAHADAFQDSETHVDPATWKHVVLRAESRWEDGTLDDVNVETLQPPEWIAAHHVTVGATVPLPLDLIEMGLPEDMKAKVLAVAPCVPLKPGPGRVVLTTVNHLNRDVCELTVEDNIGRRETVRPTGLHRFCRALDDQWVHLNEVKPGDLLHGRSGALKVLAIERIPHVHRVYNMTVEHEHIYSVSALGVLAHNNGCRPPNLTPPNAGRSGALREALRQNGVPTSQQPSRVLPNLDRRGNPQPGRVYEYDVIGPGGKKRTVRIREDSGGHNFGPNDPQNRGPHFNDEACNHYDY